MSQTKPPPWRHSTAGQLFGQLFSVGLPCGGVKSARISCRFFLPLKLAKTGERAGWIAVWSSSLTGWKKPAQFNTKIVSDVLLLSYLDKIGLSLTVEAWQALAFLYSEARLYKGPRLVGLSQSTTTRSSGNISVRIQKVGQNNTRGTVSSLFFPAQNNCCT
jgi:hypothetical protein